MADRNKTDNSSQMPVTATTRPRPSMRTRLGARMMAARWVLVAAGLVFIWLAAIGSLHPTEALGGFVAILATAALAPRRARMPFSRPDTGAALEQATRTVIGRFAEAIDLACIVIDGRGLVRHINEPGARLFPKIVPGAPISFSLRHPTLVAALDLCRTRRTGQTVDYRQTVPNDAWFRVHIAPFSPPAAPSEPQRGWMIITFTDATERYRVDTMRSDFVANASHELRTPLTSVIGFIETLQGPAARDAKARERFLAIMAAQAERMSHLIDDLLSLSRIESRQHLPPSDLVDLRNILVEVTEGLAPLAREAGLSFDLDLPPSEIQITGDRSELYEVFENLIDNAIKYGTGGEAISIHLRPITERPGYAYAVTVTDRGPGIAQEHVPRLTERFYRVDAESSRRKKGTGLGLAIVKHIVNRHRGLLIVRSEVGKGTSVDVLLPK